MKRQLNQLTRRLITSLVVVLVLAIVTLVNQHYPGLTGRAEPLAPGFYPVHEFIDGDTVAVDMNGETEIIRFIGVNTPEIHHPELPVQCFGHAAADFTQNLIGSQPVRLEADPINSNRDRYDRLLRYVYLPDGTLVNQKLVEEGYGFAYTAFEFSKASDFTAAETAAKTSNRGLWASCPADAFD